MNKIKNGLLTTLVFVFAIGLGEAHAQWQLGASFENRSEVPENGFGIHLERHHTAVPNVLTVRSRLHGSYFSEEQEDYQVNVSTTPFTITREVNSLDFGVGLFGELSIPIIPVNPYAGFGIGMEFFDVDADDPEFEMDENAFYYYGSVGLSVTVLPVLTPFVEYRMTGFNYDEAEDPATSAEEASGRFMFGISVRF